jgi:hypothetical protein
MTAEYTVPVQRRPSEARITAVYPSQGVLPANLLKFYVHFSEAMSEGHLFEHARLLDGEGRPIAQAFREVELWSADHRRVTLWINPGRTKQSLGLSESLGPVLAPGRTCTLTITPGLPDEQGRPLAKGKRHPFRTGAPDREPPDIERWQLDLPAAGSRAAFTVRFPEPLDHALASRLIRVERRPGEAVAGSAAVAEDCRSWRFTPQSAWQPGEHELVAGGELEDLAGNSLARPFETTEGQGSKPSPIPPEFRRRFRIESS